MKLKRLLSLGLATTLLASLMAGCGAGKAAPENDVKAPEAAQEVSAEKTAFEHSWEEDTSDCTVTWFFAYDWYGKKFDPVNHEFDKKLYEKTGVKIEIQTGDVDKLNMLIKTGKLPDIITMDANSTQRKMLEKSGMVQPLDVLRDKYAPDLNEPQSMVKWYTAEDGHWYSIASFYYDEDNTTQNNGFYETHNQNFARQDILNQIGMTYEDLHTKEGFIKALRAVKDQKIQYNGQPVIPYACLGEGGAKMLAQQFGAAQEDKEGNFQSIYVTPEYREAMLFLNQLYNEGLMTDISLTATQQQLMQEISAGHVFANTGWSNLEHARTALAASDPEALVLYAGQMCGDTNEKVMVPANGNMGWTATMINSKAKNPDRIIRLFAYMRTPECILDDVWGVGGWKMNENGKIERVPEMMQLKNENPTMYHEKYEGDLAYVGDYTFIQGTWPDDGTVFSQDCEKKTHDDSMVIYDDKCFSGTAPEAGTDEAAINARIEEYMKQAVGRIVTAKDADACNEEMDKTLAEIEKLGLSKLVEYQNGIFQQNKEKAGIKFVYPGNE